VREALADRVSSDVREAYSEAAGELMELPPLRDLLQVATQTTPDVRAIDVAKEQERVREKLWKLSNWDLVSFLGVGIVGRRDVFAVNTDGTVYVPTASVVDNMNTQGSVSIKVNPVSFLQNGKQAQLARLERERLDAVRETRQRDVAEGVIHAHSMAQKSLALMDARAEAYYAVAARAELAEQLFRQGAMTLSEYTEFQSKASDMAAKFQDARGDFRLYYNLLMERVYGKLP